MASSGKPTPMLKDVNRLLSPNSHKWNDIGSALDVSLNCREALMAEGAQRSNSSKLEVVLNTWLESQCSEVTWDHLIEQLRAIKLNDTADSIVEWLYADGRERYQWTGNSRYTRYLTQCDKEFQLRHDQRIDEKNTRIKQLEKELEEQERRTKELKLVFTDQITLLVDKNKVHHTNEQSLHDKCSQLEQDNRQLLENKEVLESCLKQYKEPEAKEDLTEHVETLKGQISLLQMNIDEMAAEIKQERELNKKLTEELSISQQNLCEVISTKPQDNGQMSCKNMALEALQVAYSDLEKRWKIEQKSVVRLKSKLAEMECRIKSCGDDYRIKVKENADLHEELNKIRGLVSKNYDGSEHRIDSQKKDTRIRQLEMEIKWKVMELENRQTQEETLLKTIDSLRSQIRNQHHFEDNDQHLKEVVVQVTPSKARHKSAPCHSPSVLTNPHQPLPSLQSRNHKKDPSEMECPVCNVKFPNLTPWNAFEQHVEKHFN